jgi:hypothetical protein
MRRTLVVLAMIFGSLVVASGGSDAAVLYAADGSAGHLSSLVILDQNTGAVTSVVGPIGFAVTGLAIHPLTGVLYGSTSSLDPIAAARLIRIDKTTGAGTLIGPYGIGPTMPDLTFASDGTLYGWPQGLNALHRIDTATGLATRVGNFNFNSNFGSNLPGLGLAATADALILAGSGRDPLFTVNRTTGVAAPFTTLDWQRPTSGVAALAFGPGGVLLGMGSTGIQGVDGAFLLRISLATGHVVELGPTIFLGDALAFDPPGFPASPPDPIPTLSELAFAVLALLLTAVGVSRIRRRPRPV